MKEQLATLQTHKADVETELDQLSAESNELRPRLGPAAFSVRLDPTKKNRVALESIEEAMSVRDVKARRADAELGVINQEIVLLVNGETFATKEAHAGKLGSIDDAHVEIAGRLVAWMEHGLKDLEILNGLITERAMAAEELGLKDIPEKVLSKGLHVSEWLRFKLEKYLGDSAQRAHSVFRVPLTEIENDYRSMIQDSTERRLEELRKELGLPEDFSSNGRRDDG